jgi:hypothetical protein
LGDQIVASIEMHPHPQSARSLDGSRKCTASYGAIPVRVLHSGVAGNLSSFG